MNGKGLKVPFYQSVGESAARSHASERVCHLLQVGCKPQVETRHLNFLQIEGE